ncbi:MAG: hypothetical protein JXL97_10550 [Bacteroidales bacterium]|nr:hypothetical protein [Bacteroidales bacterium]
MKSFFLVFIAVLTFNTLLGQQTTAELQQNLQLYEEFLDNSEFRKSISADNAVFYDDTLVLYLKICYNSPDSNYYAWKKLNETLLRDKNYNLSEFLFFSASNIFKQEPSKLYVFIFDTYNPLEPYLFKVIINYVNQNVLVLEEIETKSGISQINMIFNDLSDRYIEIQNGDDLRNRKEIYEFISAWSVRYFSKITKKQNQSENNNLSQIVVHSVDNEVFKFEVIGLRNEVLKEKESAWISSVISWTTGLPKESRNPTEYLKFEIQYVGIGANQFKLNCKIDGKYGLRNDVNWSTMRNMEPQFSIYLQEYTDVFLDQLKDALVEK